jgi:putative ABC transport system permease protein
MKTAYWKDTFREITKSFGRYMSLIIITALGAASVAGILATSINMRAIADKTYKERALFDVQIKSATGFDYDDISALRDTSGADIVMPTTIFDTYIYLESETRTIRVFALPNELNNIELLEGRLPENANEGAVERSLLRQWGLSIGDSVTLGLDDMDDYHEVLGSSELTIVGVVRAPFFIIPYDRGNTPRGDGRLNYYMYVHPDAFELDVYTDVYVLMEDSTKIDNLSQSYFDAAEEWVKLLKKTGSIRVKARVDEFADAQVDINDGWLEYHDGVAELEKEVADARAELNDAEFELNDALVKLEDAQVEINDAQIKIDDAQIELEDGQRELNRRIADARKEIDDNAKEIENGWAEIRTNRSRLNSGQNEIDNARKTLNDNLQTLEAIDPYGVSPELDAQYDMIYAALALIKEQQAALNSGWSRINAAERTLQEGDESLDEARTTLERERVNAQREINKGWAELEDARIELEDARLELKDGWVEYNDGIYEWLDGIETLRQEEADALIELADAKLELEDAQSKLNDAPTPEWFFFTRADNPAFDSYYQDTLRLEGIGYVFPIVFFIVAILVSLTTMSRMVDEQRTQIGIYKALGYGTARVVIKILVYAFSAGMIGGWLGVFTGSNLFPRVIYGAYLHMYDMPPIETPIPVAISLIAVATSVFLVMIVTIISSIRSMRNTPAELMRPKTPPSGKRVLIEKIPLIWNRMKFTSKVTARNIFRYKKRFIMTLAGVAGCTAILLTSFGLRDSLSSIADLQYDKLTNYTSRAFLKELKTESEQQELDTLISGRRLYIREESLTAEGSAFSVSMIVPEVADMLGEFVNLYSNTNGERLTLDNGGIFITEKLARELDITKGDTFTFTPSDGGTFNVPVTGVVENYVMHHIYVPPGLYEELFDTPPLMNSVLIDGDENSVRLLLRNDKVGAIVHTSNLRENTADATDAMDIVALVLIFLACALAFVVLFNLTNINITERLRELATIKVLGFYNEELSMYIYRENGIVTLMGIALGLVCGIFLHGYVLMAAEIDMLLFPRIVLPWSYLYSVGLSILFAIFVNLVMNFKLARIDMVESLKNVE